jgi:hypothetical protein
VRQNLSYLPGIYSIEIFPSKHVYQPTLENMVITDVHDLVGRNLYSLEECEDRFLCPPLI